MKRQLGMYSELSKARLSALVVSTTAAGFLMAGGPVVGTSLAAACVGTALCAASANTMNQTIESRTDTLMKRTFKRPLPSGRMSRAHAAAFGLSTGALGAGILLAGTNPMTAALGVANIALYAGVYTPLKRVTEANTTVGSVVGAIPPVMGWVAATGGTMAALVAPESLLVGSLLFAWQFPHFHALSYLIRKDYAAGGHMMHAVTDPSGKKAALHGLLGSLGLAAVPFACMASGVTSPMFAVEGLAVNAYVLMLATKFYRNPGDDSARKLFRASLWYLPLVMILMVYHSRHWKTNEAAAVDATAADVALATAVVDTLGGRVVAGGVEGADRGDGAAMSAVRTVLKAACPHEVIKDQQVAERGGAESHVATAMTSAECPVVVVEAAAAAPVVSAATVAAAAAAAAASPRGSAAH